jgi:hypothetical protein
MNWLLPSYYYNFKYINTKCPYCGTNVLLNRNIKSNDGQLKLIDLDHSPHNCFKYIRSVKGNSCKNNIDNKGDSKLS